MDNHQLDLARAIRQGGWARSASLGTNTFSSSSSSTGSGGKDVFPPLEEEMQVLLRSYQAGRGPKEGGVAGHVAEGRSEDEEAERQQGTLSVDGWIPTPFPQAEPARFRRLVDEEMGFV